jgi:hypothetical protein
MLSLLVQGASVVDLYVAQVVQDFKKSMPGTTRTDKAIAHMVMKLMRKKVHVSRVFHMCVLCL